jgi:hypothetical protein
MLEWTASAQEGFQNAKRLLAAAVPSNTLPQMLNFLWPLMPRILISEGSCRKNQETIGGPLDSFPVNSQTQNHVIQPLTANYWLLRQQSKISSILAKVQLFNFGQIINPLLLSFPASQSPFHPDSNAIWRSSQNLMDSCRICPV